MFFLLNTVTDPFFCALDTDGRIISETWENHRESGQKIWAFLEKHLKDLPSLNGVGGLAGPGRFSGIRLSAEVLEILSDRYDCPLYQASTDSLTEENQIKTLAQILQQSKPVEGFVPQYE